jgi:hypothetical protein
MVALTSEYPRYTRESDRHTIMNDLDSGSERAL